MEIERRIRATGKVVLRALVSFVYGGAFRRDEMRPAGRLTAPRRILLMNGAHIGDVIVATSVIPILRAAYPSVEIGVVTGSWSQMVVKDQPGVTYTHCVDHWRFNRSSGSLYRKILQFRRTRSTALKEIRGLQYDVAISMYAHFPDFLNLSWAAGIPVRIGFRTSLMASLATDIVDKPNQPFMHQGARLAELLRVLPIDPENFRLRKSTLAPSNISSVQEVCLVLQVQDLEGVRYRIIHMGTGARERELPNSFWRELAEKLSPETILLFTGRGEREEENIISVIRGLNHCVNACNRLSWSGFVAAVRHAEVLYGVESMAGHVAGAVGTKCAVVYAGAAGVAWWRPEGEGSVVFTNHVPCAPCFRPSGCAAMTCMRGISPDDLIRFWE
jgi:heptosyltransferase-3